MRLQFRTSKELRRFCWGCGAWTLCGAALPLLLTLLSPAGGAVRGDTCAAAGTFALCLYASGTWVSQCIYRGVADAPKLGNMKYAVGLLYVLSVLLGPVLLLRLGLEQWRKRREKTAAPWEKTGEP